MLLINKKMPISCNECFATDFDPYNDDWYCELLEEYDYEYEKVMSKNITEYISKGTKCEECPLLEVGKNRLGESIDVSMKHDNFDESKIEYSDDFLYGICHNVSLTDSKLLEIYKTFVDAKELIDKVSLIFENTKTIKRNHFAFVMKIGKKDNFLTWEQLDSVKTNKKKKEE